jgi:hypothetical protein
VKLGLLLCVVDELAAAAEVVDELDEFDEELPQPATTRPTPAVSAKQRMNLPIPMFPLHCLI